MSNVISFPPPSGTAMRLLTEALATGDLRKIGSPDEWIATAIDHLDGEIAGKMSGTASVSVAALHLVLMCLKTPVPRTVEQERADAVAWLDNWVLPEGTPDAGWNMAVFNAAREIERGDHVDAALVRRQPTELHGEIA